MLSLRNYSLFFSILAAVAGVNGHPGEEHKHMGPSELSARQLSANVRHVQARACAPAMASMAAERKRKRALALAKRQGSTATLTASTHTPSATAITNYTCITAPEVTEGPYYIRNEFVRQDIRDGQPGIPLQLEIGVMDTTTCKPLTNAYIEIWHANATGFYGGFTSASLGGGGGGEGGGPGANLTTGAGMPTDTTGVLSMTGIPSGTGSAPMPSGTGGMGGGGGGGPGGSTAMSDAETFLRGGWPTNDAGIVEMISVYPGFYSGRTTHIHMMVHTNYTISSNGTIVSDSGSLLHIGQMFFEESLNDRVFASSVYAANTNSRTTNSQDSIFAQESADGNDAYVDAVLLGSTIEEGIYGYITVGVNSSALYSITTTNYNTGPVVIAAAAATTSPATASNSTNGASALTVPGLFGWFLN
ncbi:hypothetical protein FRC03_009355 [Tulasnella sp. 419]|nr:hypothetical protein FRC03_009355 [Tulasnella sp. 419]